jgi:hypothetical protein
MTIQEAAQEALDCQDAYYATHKERKSAYHYYHMAHTPNKPYFEFYKNMIFCPEWDTAKGTPKARSVFARKAEVWMKQHLPCPGKGWDLHVEKTPEHPFGYFGPGGIRWRHETEIRSKSEIAEAIRKLKAYGNEEIISILEQKGYKVIAPTARTPKCQE